MTIAFMFKEWYLSCLKDNNTAMGVLANIRNDYNLAVLNEQDVLKNPIEHTQKWLDEAISMKVSEPTAMTLSTVGNNNRPTSRIVLLKEINPTGFVFFTNYTSKKGKELESNPFAALNIFWKELERQVRIEGKVIKVTPQESDAYYNSRPLSSRIGAIASPQSTIISDRSVLENKVKELEQLSEDKIKRPETWGGYIVLPDYIEFWQGRTSRLHDRISFTMENNQWIMNRLAP